MNTFSERVRLRKQLDEELLGRSAAGVYNSLGKNVQSVKAFSGGGRVVLELSRICEYLKEDIPVFPAEMTDAEELAQVLMTETGIMRRKIVTVGKWWKDGSMPLLCQKTDGSVCAVIPAASGGYVYHRDSGKVVTLNKERAKEFSHIAYCFYKPFENRALTLKDFYRFLAGAFSAADIACLLLISLAAGLIGMIMPQINRFIFNSIVPSGTSDQIFGISVLITGTVIVSALFGLSRSVWVMRIGNKLELLAQSAVWARLMNLPVSFFKKYDSGDLTQRAASINQICGILGGQLIPTLLASMFSFIYLFQISSISTEMFLPSLMTVMIMVDFYIPDSYTQLTLPTN